MVKSTKLQARQAETTPEPWQSWGMTVRYLVIRLGVAVPSVVLVWLAAACH